MDFERKIQEWIVVDNQIKLLTEKMRVLRDKKQALQDTIWKDTKRPAFVKITDGTLKFVTTRVQQPLTFQYLNKSLREIIPQEEKVVQIVDYIKTKREVKEVPEIRRVCSDKN